MQIHISVQLNKATSCLLQLDQTDCKAAMWRIALEAVEVTRFAAQV